MRSSGLTLGLGSLKRAGDEGRRLNEFSGRAFGRGRRAGRSPARRSSGGSAGAVSSERSRAVGGRSASSRGIENIRRGEDGRRGDIARRACARSDKKRRLIEIVMEKT